MYYFIFILYLSFFVICQNTIKNNKINLYIYYFFAFLIALALGLRGNGDEYSRVYYIFPSLGNFFLEENSIYLHQKGILFAIIVAILKSLQFNSQSLLIFFCFTSIFLNAIYFRKYTDYYFLAFLFYISHGLIFKEWSGLRMGLASAMLLPMIYCLYYGKKIRFLLLVTAATLIQYIAVFSIFLIFLNRKFNKVILLLGIVIAIFLYKLNVISLIVNYFINNNFLPFYISSYFEIDNMYVYDAGIGHLKTVQQIITIILLIYFFEKYKFKTPKYYNLLFNTYYLGTLLLIVFSSYSLLAFRTGGHFYSVEPILITYFAICFKQKLIVTNTLVFIALGVAYINYVVFKKVLDYEFLINYIQ